MEYNISLLLNIVFFLTIVALSVRLWRNSKAVKTVVTSERTNFAELSAISRGLAHEINNALTIIQGRTTRLLRIYKNPAHQEDMVLGLNQILYTSERIAKSVQGIREITLQDQGEGSFYLTELIKEVMVFFHQRMKNHGIDFHQRDTDGVKIFGNKVELKQMILNNISNSFDAVDNLERKWIEIKAIKNKKDVQIQFRDSSENEEETTVSLPVPRAPLMEQQTYS